MHVDKGMQRQADRCARSGLGILANHSRLLCCRYPTTMETSILIAKAAGAAQTLQQRLLRTQQPLAMM
jgi:ribosomal protein S27AE